MSRNLCLLCWAISLAAVLLIVPDKAGAAIIFDSQSGTVYSSGSVVIGNGVSTAGALEQGSIHFAAFDSSPYSQVQLQLTVIASPIQSYQVDIYGIDGTSSHVFGSDFNAGAFLGTLVIPQDYQSGQQLYFDATSFVRSAIGPYFAFNLRANGVDEFADDFTHFMSPPPELIATPVPEPSSLILTGVATILGIAVLQFHRRPRRVIVAAISV
jgi:hypothetical protein